MKIILFFLLFSYSAALKDIHALTNNILYITPQLRLDTNIKSSLLSLYNNYDLFTKYFISSEIRIGVDKLTPINIYKSQLTNFFTLNDFNTTLDINEQPNIRNYYHPNTKSLIRANYNKIINTIDIISDEKVNLEQLLLNIQHTMMNNKNIYGFYRNNYKNILLLIITDDIKCPEIYNNLIWHNFSVIIVYINTIVPINLYKVNTNLLFIYKNSLHFRVSMKNFTDQLYKNIEIIPQWSHLVPLNIVWKPNENQYIMIPDKIINSSYSEITMVQDCNTPKSLNSNKTCDITMCNKVQMDRCHIKKIILNKDYNVYHQNLSTVCEIITINQNPNCLTDTSLMNQGIKHIYCNSKNKKINTELARHLGYILVRNPCLTDIIRAEENSTCEYTEWGERIERYQFRYNKIYKNGYGADCDDDYIRYQ